MPDHEMTPVITYDSVTHLDHVHWCDLEANSLQTCIAKAHHEHAMKWAGDALSFAAIAVLLLLLLRPFARMLTGGAPGEITIRLPARRFGTRAVTAPAASR